MGRSFSELAEAYAQAQHARASWFVPARSTVDALAKLGLVGPSDRIIAWEGEGGLAGFLRKRFGEAVVFASDLTPAAFLAAGEGWRGQAAEAEVATSDACKRSAGDGSFSEPGPDDASFPADSAHVATPTDVTPEHPVHHASYAHSGGARCERLFWFVDMIGGAGLRVPDLRAFAAAAREAGAILVADDTVPSSFGCVPLELGAHLSLEALDRVAAGRLEEKVVGLSVARSRTGRGRRQRVDVLAEGAYQLLAMRLGEQVAPASAVQAADLVAIDEGLSTLASRMQRHMDHARAIAEYLACHPGVSRVSYPGLASHPDHALASTVLTHGYGPAVDFELSSPASARHLIAALGPGFRTPPAGGPCTRLSAPLGDEARYLRLFAGVDDPLDIVDSLDQALRMFCNPPQP